MNLAEDIRTGNTELANLSGADLRGANLRGADQASSLSPIVSRSALFPGHEPRILARDYLPAPRRIEPRMVEVDPDAPQGLVQAADRHRERCRRCEMRLPRSPETSTGERFEKCRPQAHYY